MLFVKIVNKIVPKCFINFPKVMAAYNNSNFNRRDINFIKLFAEVVEIVRNSVSHILMFDYTSFLFPAEYKTIMMTGYA